jgi:pseudouridylate synthase I
MQKYKMIVSYDGTDYFGWQRQPENVPTICGQIEKTLAHVFHKKIALSGASRTDCGVHALGQTVSFSLDFDIKPEKILYALNSNLPEDIFIRKLEPVSQEFNVYKNVELKIYYYHFFTSRPLPFVQRYGYFYKHPIDFDKLERALNVFVGEHDFRSFCSGDERENTVRYIKTIYLEYVNKYNAYRIVVEGPKFLRYMIRRIVGAAIQVASQDAMDINYLKNALQEKNPEQPLLPNAPPKGLLLYKIKYSK